MKLYPLKFEPIMHYRMWAGDKLKAVLDKSYDGDSMGESWEISAVNDSETQVSQGALSGYTINQLTAQFKEQFLGKRVMERFGTEFPLLIKFIDARTPLSIQVHPGDKLAKERHNSFGKNEMWYIMQADPGANIVVGFNQQLDGASYKKHIEDKNFATTLNEIQVHAGDTFYIPTGRVHAIGAGVLLAEIQQSSDVTYRIYDYDRVDGSTGKTRELHVDLAMDAIDYELQDSYQTHYEQQVNEVNTMIDSPYFTTNYIELDGVLNTDHSDKDSFVIYICVGGAASLRYEGETYNLKMGESLLLPACVNECTVVAAHALLLETYIS
jgi:mannose-6-phosphate isomerase